MRTIRPVALAHRTFIVSAALLAFLALGGIVVAQKLEVKTNHDPDADFSAIKTYAWLPPAPVIKNTSDAVSNPTLSQEALGPSIVAAVDKQLAARGLVPADRVGFNQTYLGEYYGYVTGWGSPIAPGLAPSTSMTVYEKGAVVIDIVQRASKRAIWRGSVVTRVHQERTLDERIARINDGVERIFKRFPIQPKK
jgi:hypothetical protein